LPAPDSGDGNIFYFSPENAPILKNSLIFFIKQEEFLLSGRTIFFVKTGLGRKREKKAHNKAKSGVILSVEQFFIQKAEKQWNFLNNNHITR